MHSTRRKVHVQLNRGGGVLVTEKEVDIAVGLLDKTQRGHVRPAAAAKRIAPLMPDTAGLFGKQPMTASTLKATIMENTVSMFDPVEAAFRCFLEEGKEHIDLASLRKVLAHFA